MHRDASPPSQADPHHPQHAALHIDTMKAILVERLWDGLFYLALLGTPASLMRIAQTGWQAIYGVHIGIASAIFAMTWWRRRVPSMVKAAFIMGALVMMSVLGLINFGLMSQSGSILIVFMILSGMLFTKRTALRMSLLFASVMVAIGVGFTTERLQVSFDANVYMHSLSGWTFLFLGATLFGAFVAIGVRVQRDFIHKLLRENEQQHRCIVHQASHDTLTQLPTLRLAMDRLQMAIHTAKRSQGKVALMFVDLDGFKQVNDNYGHAAGDYVLQQVALRLAAIVRTSDTVARVGGDEFVVILGQQADQEHAAATAMRMIEALQLPIGYHSHSLCVGCSVGIAMCPDHGEDPDSLKRAADAAMYQVKKAGKNNYVFATEPVQLQLPLHAAPAPHAPSQR